MLQGLPPGVDGVEVVVVDVAEDWNSEVSRLELNDCCKRGWKMLGLLFLLMGFCEYKKGEEGND